jgi:Ca2+-binding RTX toxin-like protein
VTGTDSANSLKGGAGADVIIAKAGNDSIDGGAGNDWLFGGLGADTIIGSRGADRLYGQEGDDQLTGGADADLFGFNHAGFGRDTILDFSASSGDLIDLRGLGLSFADLTIVGVGTSAHIAIGDDVIVLSQVAAASVVGGLFLF